MDGAQMVLVGERHCTQYYEAAILSRPLKTPRRRHRGNQNPSHGDPPNNSNTLFHNRQARLQVTRG
ncbi:hypothetical protein BDQ17DRAFT_1377638 [Cyathus striatus]|nr:hypothetical protein BDQ17DRAFT_1377638 [Cyathus striatus]